MSGNRLYICMNKANCISRDNIQYSQLRTHSSLAQSKIYVIHSCLQSQNYLSSAYDLAVPYTMLFKYYEWNIRFPVRVYYFIWININIFCNSKLLHKLYLTHCQLRYIPHVYILSNLGIIFIHQYTIIATCNNIIIIHAIISNYWTLNDLFTICVGQNSHKIGHDIYCWSWNVITELGCCDGISHFMTNCNSECQAWKRLFIYW